MVTIRWHLDIPEAAPRTFRLDATKSWKGSLVKGHDVAEMIADDIWRYEAIALRKLHIDGPSQFAGTYEIVPVFEPMFTAKKSESVALTTVAPNALKM